MNIENICNFGFWNVYPSWKFWVLKLKRKGPGKIIRSHSDPQNTPVQIKATENHVLGVGFSKVFALVPIMGYCKILSEGGREDQYWIWHGALGARYAWWIWNHIGCSQLLNFCLLLYKISENQTWYLSKILHHRNCRPKVLYCKSA